MYSVLRNRPPNRITKKVVLCFVVNKQLASFEVVVVVVIVVVVVVVVVVAVGAYILIHVHESSKAPGLCIASLR